MKGLYWFLGLILVGFAGACYFTFPAWDDFDYGFLVSSRTFWEFLKYHHLSWGGRYTSNAILSWMIQADPTWDYYGSWSLLILLTTLAGFAFMIKKAMTLVDGVKVLPVFLVVMTVYIAAMPTIVQLFYWVTGALSYTLAIAASAVGVGLIIQREQRPSALVDAALLVLTLIIVGHNEICLIGWMQVLLTYALLKYARTRQMDWSLVAIIILGTAAGLFSLLAPGNFVRQKEFEKSGQVFRTVGNGILHYFIFSIKLLTIPLVVLLIRWRKEVIAFADKIMQGIPLKEARAVLWGHWFLFLFTESALAFWAMGRKPNTRSINAMIFYYWLMLPFILWLLASYKRELPARIQRGFSFVDRHWILLFLIPLVASKNVRHLGIDYATKFMPYQQEVAARTELLKNGKGQVVTVSPFKTRPMTTFYNDLSERDASNLSTIFGLQGLIYKP